MPRKPRYFLPNLPVHIVIRGNSRGVVFAEDDDYQAYLGWLRDGASKYACQVYAYVLMNNHVHLLVSASDPSNISKLPQHVGRHYVPYFNHKYGRSGTLWEGRFKASTIDSAQYLLACYRYIELNPVKAGMVKFPGDYRWSSYGLNALGKQDELLTPHSEYLSLGKDDAARQQAYRLFFDELPETSLTQEIGRSVQTGTPLGNDRFKADIEKLLGKKVGYSSQGRPRILLPSESRS